MGVRIDPLTMAETVAATEQFVRDKKPLHLMGVNADKLNQCATDEAIKKIVNESEIINADGASFSRHAIWAILCQNAWQASI